MGNDGGTKAVNRKYLRGAKLTTRDVTSTAARNEEAGIQASTCAVSAEPLREPVVACRAGLLYNKEEILKHLVQKTLESAFDHINGLKDLTTCAFTPNPALLASSSSSSSTSKTTPTATTADQEQQQAYWADASSRPAQFICPVTLVEMNGRHPFVVLRPSGKVFAAKALEQVPSLAEEGQTAVHLFPTEQQLTEIRASLRQENDARKARKANKKRQRETTEVSSSQMVTAGSSSRPHDSGARAKSSKTSKHEDQRDPKDLEERRAIRRKRANMITGAVNSNVQTIGAGLLASAKSIANQTKAKLAIKASDSNYNSLFNQQSATAQGAAPKAERDGLFMLGNVRGNVRG
jgi:hypothetical protein